MWIAGNELRCPPAGGWQRGVAWARESASTSDVLRCEAGFLKLEVQVVAARDLAEAAVSSPSRSKNKNPEED